MKLSAPALAFCIALLVTLGCRSPYYADQGALAGGLGGAGLGAIIGNQLGSTGAGAVIGAGVGTLAGAAIGSGLDEVEARNRAQIAAQLGREVQAGSVQPDEVIAMSRAGVAENLIITHIQHNGIARPLTSNDLIYLKNQGVADNVIQAMQAPPPPRQAPPMVIQDPGPRPVIVEEYYYAPPPPPYYWRPYHHHHYYHRPHGVSWGVSVKN